MPVPAIDPLRAQYPQANIWRRQMVLGPAAEFGVEMPGNEEPEAASLGDPPRPAGAPAASGVTGLR
jgi:hypothetical protein